jgi:hypothetical protein
MSQPREGRLTEAEQNERRAAIPAIFAKTSYLAWLGLVVERYEPDDVATRLPFRLELSNDCTTYHGRRRRRGDRHDGCTRGVVEPRLRPGHAGFHGLHGAPIRRGKLRRGPAVFGAHRSSCARAHLHRDRCDGRVSKVLAHGLQTYRIA